MGSFPETYNDPLLLLVVVVVGREGGGEVRESGLSKFKGAVNLINLNILDKPVKTL